MVAHRILVPFVRVRVFPRQQISGMPCGVMVAHRILVPFVRVRVFPRQQSIRLYLISFGALAHLARAFDWQSRGDEFESRMLHKATSKAISI